MKIQHSRPFLDTEELAIAGAVILSGQLAQGAVVDQLEQELAGVVGHRYGIAVSSGTAALYSVLRGLGVGPGHDVVIPTYVCTALLNAVVMAGAKPILCDVDPDTGNPTADSVRVRLTRRTRAVIVPHMFGYPADAVGIERLGVPVIEDCAQCVGARTGKKAVGAQTVASVFSFYATKLLAGGEGGMVVTSDRRLRERIVALREYDKRDTWQPSFNFKLSNLHAALALAQLRKLPRMLALRNAAADRYRVQLQRCDAQLPPADQTVYYRYVVRLCRPAGPVVKALRACGIECGAPVYKPLHRYLGVPGFPSAERLQKTSISLPMHPGLTEKEVRYVARELVRQAGGKG